MGLNDDCVENEITQSALALDEVVEDQQAGSKQSRLISKVLSPALRLWIRSQLDHVEDLQLEIAAGDRQLLSGAIQQVSASARRGIYQGLHLSQISLVGRQIQTNLGQVLRGKPFRLLTAFPIAGTVALSEADLNASLQAPLLANAVSDFLLSFLLNSQSDHSSTDLTQKTASFHDVRVQLSEEALTFTANLALAKQPAYPITIRTGLRVQDGNLLILEHFQCQMHGSEAGILPANLPDRWVFNLGSEVCLEELRIQPEQICCQGRIIVQP